MKPATARDCLSHCRDRMSEADYLIAIEQIEALVAVARLDARADHQAIYERRFAALQYEPISPDEVKP